MRKSRDRTAQFGDAERTVVRERLNGFLRRLYPHKTADNVSADTGISANTIAKWLERGSSPTSWAFLRLLTAYGPELVCAIVDDPPEWLSRAAREEEGRRLRAEIEALEAKLARNAA